MVLPKQLIFALPVLICLVPLQVAAQADVDVAYGIRLGAPLSIPECPKRERLGTVLYEGSATPCVKTLNPTLAASDFSKGGWIVFPYNQRPAQSSDDIVGLSLHEGRVGVLVVSTAGQPVQERILDELVAKYGKPTTSSLVPLQNALGAKYDGIVAKWDLNPIEVQFLGVAGRIGQGQLLIGTKEGLRERQARIDRVLKSNKTPL